MTRILNEIKKRRQAIEVLIWALAGFTYLLKLGQFWSLYGNTGVSDPLGYPHLARASHFFYDSGSREPLYIFFVKMAILMVTDEILALRLLSALATLTAAAILIFWVRTKWGFMAALGAAIACMSNRIALYYSCQGYNMVAYAAALAAFGGIWCPALNARWRDWLWGPIAGLTGLIRLEGLAVTTSCLLTDSIVFKKSFRKTLRSVAVAVALVAPYLVTNKIQHGRFFFSHWGHAAYWSHRADSTAFQWNAEPSSMAMTVHQIFDVVRLWLYGLALGLTWYLWRLWQGALWVLPAALLGWWSLTAIERWRFLIFLVSILFPVAWILPLNQVGPGSGVELRFVLPLVWPIAALGGLGIKKFLFGVGARQVVSFPHGSRVLF
ncbi:MAG: hypothetical protein HY547_06140 [Elusimicrobia bacterium]|nr:hypothetical protein [Elusimicrobiota bacterium]